MNTKEAEKIRGNIKNLIFVDCEAKGKSPSTGKMTEFGAVAYPSRASFHGVLEDKGLAEEKEIFEKFDKWITETTNGGRPIFVSDNPAFDWQWINDGFWRTIITPFMMPWAILKHSRNY